MCKRLSELKTDFRSDWPSLMAHSVASVLLVLSCPCMPYSAMIHNLPNPWWKKR